MISFICLFSLGEVSNMYLRLYFYISCFKYALNMFVPLLINVALVMLQVLVNSWVEEPVCFYWLLMLLTYQR